jgi:ketosteroid isomerase-like protein
MSTLLKKRIYDIYEAFSAAKLDLLVDVFDEHVDFFTNAPADVFPYLGRRVGRPAVLKALSAVHAEFESLTFLPIWIVVEDDTAGTILSIHATQRTTKRALRFFAAHFLRFRDDRIVEYRSIMDSFEAVQQILGHELDVNTGRGRLDELPRND